MADLEADLGELVTEPISIDALKSFIRRLTIKDGFHGLMTKAIEDCANCAERLIELEPWVGQAADTIEDLSARVKELEPYRDRVIRDKINRDELIRRRNVREVGE